MLLASVSSGVSMKILNEAGLHDLAPRVTYEMLISDAPQQTLDF